MSNDDSTTFRASGKHLKNIRNIDTFYVLRIDARATKSKGDGQVRELTIVSR